MADKFKSTEWIVAKKERPKSTEWMVVTNKRSKKNFQPDNLWSEIRPKTPQSNEKITIKCNGQIQTY
jgi:hypothetical protein